MVDLCAYFNICDLLVALGAQAHGHRDTQAMT